MSNSTHVRTTLNLAEVDSYLSNCRGLLLKLIAEAGFNFLVSSSWNYISLKKFSKLDSMTDFVLVGQERNKYSPEENHKIDQNVFDRSVWRLGTDKDPIAYCYVTSGNKATTIEVFSNDTTVAEKIMDGIHARLGSENKPNNDFGINKANTYFWYWMPRGIERLERVIDTVSWVDVKRNYIPTTRNAFENLVELRNIPPGKIVLLHGPPGTGKSSAIRALMEAWKSWSIGHYILDPEKFFTDPQYIMEVLEDSEITDAIYENGTVISEHPDEQQKDIGQVSQLSNNILDFLKSFENWNATSSSTTFHKVPIIILEDTDEYISSDAKAKSGQNIARVLNLADGILGQGLSFILLFSTNEPITSISDAVARPGRCIANIEFDEFNNEMAKDWLGVGSVLHPQGKQGFSLAELYSIKHNRKVHSAEKVVANVGGQYL